MREPLLWMVMLPLSIILFAFAAIVVWSLYDTIKQETRKRHMTELTDEAMTNLMNRLKKEEK